MAPTDGTTVLHHDASPEGTGRAAAAGARVEHLPVAVFSVVMGLAGTAVAWQRAAGPLGVPPQVGQVLAWLAAAVLVLATAGYALKAVRFPAAARAEWSHPVKLAFVPTTGISLVVLAAALAGPSRSLSAALWWTGAALQFLLTLHVVRTWIDGARFAVQHVHPAWFIPAVGNLVVPLGRPAEVPAQVAWYFFAVGLVYWLALMPLVVGRLVVGGPLPPRLTPTLAVLVAPPAVAALAWVSLGGRWDDPVAVVLLDVALFQAFLLVSQAPALARVPFALTAWAYSFPLAAVATASLAAGHAGLGTVYDVLGVALLSALTVLVAGLGARTVLAAARGEICRPDPS